MQEEGRRVECCFCRPVITSHSNITDIVFSSSKPCCASAEKICFILDENFQKYLWLYTCYLYFYWSPIYNVFFPEGTAPWSNRIDAHLSLPPFVSRFCFYVLILFMWIMSVKEVEKRNIHPAVLKEIELHFITVLLSVDEWKGKATQRQLDKELTVHLLWILKTKWNLFQ